MKKITQIFILLSINLIWSQADYSTSWDDFYSYNNVKEFIKTEDKVYAMVDNAIFTYDIITNDLKKISSVNGLSGETMTSIHFSKQLNKLVIGYSTGLLEIVEDNSTIKVAKDIVNFNHSGSKRINSISEYNNKLYLATSFAIIVYDLENGQFGDTYFIGNQSSEIVVNDIEIDGNLIFAATENGIFIADISDPNLIDFNNWNQISMGNFSKLELFNNQVYVNKGRSLYTIKNDQLVLKKNFSQTINNIQSSSEYLTICSSRYAFILDQNNQELFRYTSSSSDEYYPTLNSALYDKNRLFLGSKEFGLLVSESGSISSFYEIHPEGPFSNAPFSIEVKNNNLWVVYGSYNATYAPLGRRFGFSHFNGDKWINTPYSSEILRDLVNITIDPFHENKVYLSSWGGGMLVVENDAIINTWNHLNSGLEKLVYSNPNYVSIRINGAAFDSRGNLWIANAWIDERIKKYSTEGNWSSFDMSSTITNPALGLSELVIDKANNIWIGSRKNGVLVFNEDGNKKKSLTSEKSKGSLPDLNVRTVNIDSRNRIWIGTKKGLVVLNNGAGVFNNNSIDTEPIIVLDDGIPKKLLGDQPINSIAIDGADNKWFGTELSGVFQTNSNGTVTLNHFNKSNSPLPSNNILKVTVDDLSGKVYIATDKGIVVFSSNVSSFGDHLPEVYAYPNPSTRNNEAITIDGRNGTHLPYGTNVKILDTAGNLVYETNIKEDKELFGGKIVWNKTNLAGRKVASGVYIVLLSANDNMETTVAKIAIIN